MQAADRKADNGAAPLINTALTLDTPFDTSAQSMAGSERAPPNSEKIERVRIDLDPEVAASSRRVHLVADSRQTLHGWLCRIIPGYSTSNKHQISVTAAGTPVPAEILRAPLSAFGALQLRVAFRGGLAGGGLGCSKSTVYPAPPAPVAAQQVTDPTPEIDDSTAAAVEYWEPKPSARVNGTPGRSCWHHTVSGLCCHPLASN